MCVCVCVRFYFRLFLQTSKLFMKSVIVSDSEVDIIAIF